MAQSALHKSMRTKVIARALLIPFAVGVALIVALLLCFAADLLGLWREGVGRAFPIIVVLLVYDAGVTLLLRFALILSARWDRSS
jgi:hypothetical protein